MAAPVVVESRASSGRPVNRVVLVVGLLVVAPLVAILVANLGRYPHMIDSPLVGRMAPAFSLTGLEGGEPVTLASLHGRPVVLTFWATWCVPCLDEHPALASAARSLGERVRFLGVVYEDDPAQVRAFQARSGAPFPSLLDPGSRAAIAFGVFGVPETYFIDAQGRIVAKQVGPLDPATLAEKLRLVGVEP